MSSEIKKNYGGYTLVNSEKLDRAINGTIGRAGALAGGVGEKASDAEVLAEYDRLGGLILKGEYKVKTGSFFNFAKRVPHDEPEVLLVMRDIHGEEIELSEDEPVPLEVRAAQVQAKKKKEKAEKEKSRKKGKKGSKKDTEVEEEEESEDEENDGDDE